MKNSLSVVFQNRDFTACLAPSYLKFEVNSYSFGVIGGCAEASITVYGDDLGLEEMLNWLRRPVTIYDKRGVALWWGYVHGAQVRKDAIEIAPNLDSMYNRVAVAYSYVEPNTQTVGVRKTTDWEDDVDSQAEFGVRELLSSADGMSDAAALARRTAVLQGQAWPYGALSQFGSPRGAVRYSGAKKSASATLVCKGWWKTLEWKYAGVITANTVSHTPAVTDDAGIGHDTTFSRYGQSLKVGNFSVQAVAITAQYKNTGGATDDVTISLQADVSGAPSGTALASVTFAATTITSATYATYSHTFTTPYTMAPNTTYWLVWQRSGALSATRVQLGNVRPGAYADGKLRYYSTSDGLWHDDGGNGDAYFAFNQSNVIFNTTQIVDLVTQYGQFMTACDLDTTGVALPSFQNGDKSTLAVILELLAVGGPNGRRLLADVDVNRRVRVYEEPGPGDVGFTMNSQAQVFGPGGIAVQENAPPVGAWVRLKDVLSGVVDLTKIADPSLQFIESASWSASGGASYGFKGKPSIDSLLAIGG
jgi:hypothetical protein